LWINQILRGLKLNFRIVIILALSLPVLVGCPFKTKKGNLRDSVADGCAQDVINIYQLYHRSSQLKFGPHDEVFRVEFKKVVDRYVETGKDMYGKEKIAFIQRYLPNYMKTCKKFHDPFVDNCSSFYGDQEKLDVCYKPYHEAYGQLLGAFGVRLVQAQTDTIDLDAFDIEYLRKMKMRMRFGH